MIELKVLGGLDLRGPPDRDCRAVLAQPKRLALLAFLALTRHQGFARRDTLVAFFWPESDANHARSALRQTLSFLRRALGPEILTSRAAEEVAVNEAACFCDAVAFDRACEAGDLDAAVGLYRGELLQGLYVTDASPDLEHWIEDERARLRNRAAQAAWKLVGRWEAKGNVELAAEHARRALALFPEDEGGLRRLVTLLERLEDYDGALRVFQTFQRRLAAGYDVQPGAETTALMVRVRSRIGGAPVRSGAGVAELERPGVAGAPAEHSAGSEPVARAYTAPDDPPADDRVARAASLAPVVRKATFTLFGDVLRFRIRIAVAALASIAGVAAIAFGIHARGEPPPLSVAVLPFSDSSTQRTEQHLADRISKELTDALGDTPELRVASRTSVVGFRDTSRDLRQIAHALDVAAVVKGYVRREGGEVRVTAQLVDATSGHQLWSATYDVKAQSAHELGRGMAAAMLASLAPRPRGVGTPPATASPTHDQLAHDRYLKARVILNQGTLAGLKSAAQQLEQAVQRDPEFARAYGLLALVYTSMPLYGEVAPSDAYPRGQAAALRALELDPTTAEATGALARVSAYFHWDWNEGDRLFRRSLALGPGDSNAHIDYGDFLSATGRLGESIVQFERAKVLDPSSRRAPNNLARRLIWAGQYDRAMAELHIALELEPNFARAHRTLGLLYIQVGRYADAIAELRRACELSGNRAFDLAALADAYVRAGRRAEAEQILSDLVERERGAYVPPMAIATIHASLGRRDEAFAWLDRAADARDVTLALTVLHESSLDPIRSDPRFAALLRRMRLPP